MIGYYQDREDGRCKWIEFNDSELAEVKKVAYHISPYLLNKSPEEAGKEPIIYKGDLTIDIDHKPADGETLQDAINRSIVDVQNLKGYFESIELKPDDCDWFISGGKGFHVVVPRKALGANNGYENLPLLHKYVVSVLAYRADIKGIDFGLYATGKGHLLRVENKQRENGFYKVQISPFELDDLTPERYFEIAKEPREDFTGAASSIPVCAEMAALFQEAVVNFKRPKKQEALVSADTFLQLEGELPTCMKQILARENIKAATGEFNSAKQSLARYLSTAVPDDGVSREALITQFAEAWDSTRFRTVKEREKEVHAALRCYEGKDFNCSVVKSGFETSPCQGCPVGASLKTAGVSLGPAFQGIIPEDGVYKKSTKDGDVFPISNFVMNTLTAFYMSDRPDHIDSLLVSIKVVDSTKSVQTQLIPKDLKTKTGLKNATCSVAGSSFSGSDDDADKIYALLTNEKVLSEVKQMTAVKTLGVIHHVSPAREINEMVWVQEGWSVNTNGIEDTVHYSSPIRRQGATNEHESAVLDLRDTPEFISEEAMQVFIALVNSRRKETSASFLGFVAACWLKPILQRKEVDNVFPALQVFGVAGSGKTSLTQRWVILGGSNSSNTRSVSLSTPASLRTAGYTTTTVPIIFDEFNVTRCPKERYTMAREVIKSSATKQSLEFQSKNGDGSLTQNSLVCSSPIVTLATSRSLEAEIEERTEKILLLKEDIEHGREHPFNKNFAFVKKNAVLLNELAGAFMREALTVDREWVFTTQEKCSDQIDHLVPDNREKVITQTILVGLEFAEAVINARYKGSKTAIQNLFYDMKSEYFRNLETNMAAKVKRKGEIDNFFDRLSQIASEMTRKNEPMLLEDIHFVKDANHLHLKVISLFGVYKNWMRQNPNLMNEFQSPSSLMEEIRKYPAFVGVGLNPEFSSPDDWATLTLGGLTERGINVQRFDRK